MDLTLRAVAFTLDIGTVIEVKGVLGKTTASLFIEPLNAGVLATINGTKATLLTVDLRQLTLIDSSGLELLINARKRLSSAGCSLQVILTPGLQPERVMKTGRFDAIMALKYDIEGSEE